MKNIILICLLFLSIGAIAQKIPVGSASINPVAQGNFTFNKYLNPLPWTTATRPSSPTTGSAGYNTDSTGWEYYDGSAWHKFSTNAVTSNWSTLLNSGVGLKFGLSSNNTLNFYTNNILRATVDSSSGNWTFPNRLNVGGTGITGTGVGITVASGQYAIGTNIGGVFTWNLGPGGVSGITTGWNTPVSSFGVTSGGGAGFYSTGLIQLRSGYSSTDNLQIGSVFGVRLQETTTLNSSFSLPYPSLYLNSTIINTINGNTYSAISVNPNISGTSLQHYNALYANSGDIRDSLGSIYVGGADTANNASSIADFNSTTKGSLVFPRHTSVQRKAITTGQINNGTYTFSGTYTNGTYTAVASTTTGSGTGATFNVTVAGNTVTVLAINSRGSGYNPNDAVTISNSVIGGTGANIVYTVANIQSDGLFSFDSTSRKPYYSFHNVWYPLLDSTSSGSGATGANPTATIGTTAVNGSATTFMRSDAAPAIPQATSSTFGAIKVDGTSIVATSGVISTALVTASASYTPTLTNTTNVTSSALTVAYYSRVGNIITVQIGGTLTPTTALSASVLTFTLPITTTNGTQTNCGTAAIGLNSGTVYTSGIANVVSTTTGTLLLVAPSLGGTTSNFSITFVYTL